MALDTILHELSVDRAWEHMEWLNANAPLRISGSDDDRRAAQYFVDCLRSYGLDPRLDTFTAYLSEPRRASLQVLSPTQQDIPCAACAHIASTPDPGVEGELMFVGPGADEDYVGRDVRDKIVLAEISYAPPRTEKAQIAIRHGAGAIVYMNWGLPEHGTIPQGAIKSVWGNPTRETMKQIPRIPAVGISRAAGDALRAQLERGPVRVLLVAQATRGWGSLTQPRVRVPAGRPGGEFLLVAGHYDAWKPGMTDNGAGNALMLELARVFAAHRHALRRDIEFVFWNGHEIGDMEGSTWYLDTHWDELDQHCVAYFNVDTVGIAGTSRYVTRASPELKRFHDGVEQRVLGTPGDHAPLTRTGDQSFFGIGIPSLYGQYHHSVEQIASWHNATLGWWWHSEADTLDKVDRGRFRQTADVYAGYIWEMGTADLLPMDVVTLADDLARRVDRVQEIAGQHFRLDLPVAPFCAAATSLDRLMREAQDDAQHRELIPKVNHTLMRLSRILTPAFATAGGRYAQDRYGLVALNAPVPSLYEVERFAGAPADSEIRHLLFTELIRERNKLSDALRRATETIQALFRRDQ